MNEHPATHDETHGEHDEFEGLSCAEIEFLGDLRAVFEKHGDLAKKFEVTYQVSRLFGRLEDGQAMVPIERCKSPIFNLLVKTHDEARQLAKEQAMAAGAADPCCWWKWNGVKFVCVAFS